MNSSLRQRIEREAPRVNAGWTVFPIFFEEDLKVDGDDCFGVTDFDTQQITIRSNVDDNMIKQTLIHEMWHVIWSTMGLRDHNEDPYKELVTNQEFLVEQTTRGSLLFQHLNPVLWRILYYDN